MAQHSTLQACRKLAEQGVEDICALNFASGRNPGGGFQKGSSAQEESLCRSSGLYYCLKDQRMYHINNRDRNQYKYADMGYYSPRVPVIKDDEGNSIPRYYVKLITCPAVNAIHARKVIGEEGVNAAMRTRIQLILHAASMHKQTTIVLGAFGCGVFGNRLAAVMAIFRELLPQFGFRTVIFPAITDTDYSMMTSTLGLVES